MTRTPPLELLDPTPQVPNHEDYHSLAIEDLASEHSIKLEVVGCDRGASVTRYLLAPGPGVTPKRVEALTDALSVALGHPVRYAGVSGTAIAIEVANEHRAMVTLRQVIESAPAQPRLGLFVGQDVAGKGVSASLANLPHLLVGGATGQGKSVAINSMIVGLAMQNTPADLRLTLIDPKRVEFAPYARLPHLHLPIVTDVAAAARVLKEAAAMMDARYATMEEAGARSIAEYNDAADNRWPSHVIIIDELADLVMQVKDVETHLVRIAQKGRAAGVHLVLATQYPTAKCVTPMIGQNVPSRMALTTANHTASNVIIGRSGAERLSGKGDALWSPIGELQPIRVQTPYVSDDEIARVVAWWVEQSTPSRDAERQVELEKAERVAEQERLGREASQREIDRRREQADRARKMLAEPPVTASMPRPQVEISLDDQVRMSVIEKAASSELTMRIEELERVSRYQEQVIKLLVLSAGMDISGITQ